MEAESTTGTLRASANAAAPVKPSSPLAGSGAPLREILASVPRLVSLADNRRRKLTQMDVLADRDHLNSLNITHLFVAIGGYLMYTTIVFPRVRDFGRAGWQAAVASGSLEPRAGGPFAEVSWALTFLLSVLYVCLVLTGMGRMRRWRLPARILLFEFMAVHNFVQCAMNIYCFCGLLVAGWSLNAKVWGNTMDTSERGYALGSFIWLQFHCRQLQLVDTWFVVLRKKFHGISFFHLYLRVLNLWGWYFACRFQCGGEAYFPAVVSAASQALVYGIYCVLSFKGSDATVVPWVTRIAMVHITQYVTCALHSILAAIFGNFPGWLAGLHLFVIANGLILYTDFHSAQPANANEPNSGKSKRVTFSFDSCGWLMVYHFGVSAWLYDHLQLKRTGTVGSVAPEGVAFSGSSGGSLISVVLGSGTDPREVFKYMLQQYPLCRRNFTEMFPAVERALRKFQYAGAHRRLSGHIRVLLTRVTPWPPFVLGEVADDFADNETAIRKCCASCHVPIVAGVRPLKIGDGYYYDGLLWPSRLFVPWRAADGDHVVRISSVPNGVGDICIMQRVPLWWMILPPPPHILRGIFWCGYRDAARWFSKEPTSHSTCVCRRREEATEDFGDGGESDGPHESDGKQNVHWHAALALMQKPLEDRTPEVDPETSEDIAMLIRRAEEVASRQSWLASAFLVALAVVIATTLLALDPTVSTWHTGPSTATG
eukprot:TRINITY_DN18823_c0_g2_i2.p1 TRINITY_DN18823_c0_g2~~TRINITY_DN18823_c0_g2_i2.p1  ORF type:complete len:728 (-),score=42.29 TRINITY_DN18823_c0_g2_i2:73-2208(-)